MFFTFNQLFIHLIELNWTEFYLFTYFICLYTPPPFWLSVIDVASGLLKFCWYQFIYIYIPKLSQKKNRKKKALLSILWQKKRASICSKMKCTHYNRYLIMVYLIAGGTHERNWGIGTLWVSQANPVAVQTST